ncbi:MAG: GIY-YIG nuclease family protein [Bacteroidales bacterium]|nr:GIY-YIG nuclease family protein [Bacteroidales bacterium]
MYAVVDIETTGGSPRTEKITEIAVYIFDGKKIIDEFISLVNPEKLIPYFITSLTGINNEMVADAPKFYEIAKQIVELTEDKILVAHNASFDYKFIKSEFKSLGFDFIRNNLCTLQLSRKLIPGHRSYSLGKLCGDLGIKIENRHRAAGDALATVELLKILMKQSNQEGAEDVLAASARPNLKNLHPQLDQAYLDNIPEETGVYYFLNDQHQVIYIGKSKNIRKRILSHLSNNASRRSIELKESIAQVEYELTGSELVALLVESSEIKKHSPFYNRAQKRKTMQYGLYSFKDENGYMNLKIDKTSGRANETPHTCFTAKSEATSILSKLSERHWLCQKLCGLYETDGACFHHEIRQCNGACVGKESAAIYNNRVTKAIGTFYYENKNFLIIDKGRINTERSVVQVEQGKYIGFGYLDVDESYLHMESFLDCVKIYEDNRDIHQIIKTYMNKNNVEKIIRY